MQVGSCCCHAPLTYFASSYSFGKWSKMKFVPPDKFILDALPEIFTVAGHWVCLTGYIVKNGDRRKCFIISHSEPCRVVGCRQRKENSPWRDPLHATKITILKAQRKTVVIAHFSLQMAALHHKKASVAWPVSGSWTTIFKAIKNLRM